MLALHFRSLADFFVLRIRYVPNPPADTVGHLITAHNRWPMIHDPHLVGYLSLPLLMLGAFGLYSVRSGITTDTAKAVSDIVAQVAPAPTPVAPRPDHPDDPAFHSGSKMAGK